jgi:prolyl-tRNA synthetase
LTEVYTPNVTTIATLADFLQIDQSETAKAVFMVAEIEETAEKSYEKFVFAVVRGDMELNETKLSNAIKAKRLRPATSEEIRSIGAEPGYGSPLGIDRSKVLLVVDDLVAESPNLVAGANRVDYHMRNVNYGRDYTADVVQDIVAASDGYPCPVCGSPLRTVRGVEVGNIFKLGTKYSVAMGAFFLDENGESKPIVMGCYGIGSERMIACIIEHHHDDQGIKWPITIAPYQVMLVGLGTDKTPEVVEAAERIYVDLKALGIEVLYDDRDERAGVKFNDADLLGIPLRLTVGGKGLKSGALELKLRRSGELREIPVEGVAQAVKAIIDDEIEAIHATLKPELLA